MPDPIPVPINQWPDPIRLRRSDVEALRKQAAKYDGVGFGSFRDARDRPCCIHGLAGSHENADLHSMWTSRSKRLLSGGLHTPDNDAVFRPDEGRIPFDLFIWRLAYRYGVIITEE